MTTPLPIYRLTSTGPWDIEQRFLVLRWDFGRTMVRWEDVAPPQYREAAEFLQFLVAPSDTYLSFQEGISSVRAVRDFASRLQLGQIADVLQDIEEEAREELAKSPTGVVEDFRFDLTLSAAIWMDKLIYGKPGEHERICSLARSLAEDICPMQVVDRTEFYRWLDPVIDAIPDYAQRIARATKPSTSELFAQHHLFHLGLRLSHTDVITSGPPISRYMEVATSGERFTHEHTWAPSGHHIERAG